MNKGGRPKGRANNITREVRQLLKEFSRNNFSKIQELFDQVAEDDPAKALDLWLRCVAFVTPKPAPEVITPEDDDRITEIEISIVPAPDGGESGEGDNA